MNNAKLNADAIVVLAGNRRSRIFTALRLARKHYAPQILLTQAHSKDSNRSDILAIEALFKEFKAEVPYQILPTLTPSGVVSTFDEAYDVLEYLKQHPIQRLILVTDAFHTRRALLAFEKVLSQAGVQVSVYGMQNPVFNETNWWKHPNGRTIYFKEIVKYSYYLWANKNFQFGHYSFELE